MMLSAQELLNLDAGQRGQTILASIDNLAEIEDELEQAKAVSTVINTFIDTYIDLKVKADIHKEPSILEAERLKRAIQVEIDTFLPKAIAELKTSLPSVEHLLKSHKNIYELAGARRLAYANRVTRNLSTTMGLLWERIANISPYAISPELEFGLHIKGIDVIAKNKQTGVIEYIQLKTQKNTLTGSQQSRSINELSIHTNPVFAVCFDTKTSWTFSANHNIPRAVGPEFWGRIGISYDIFLESVKEMILALEQEYVKLLNEAG